MVSVKALSFLTKVFPFTLPDNSRQKEHFRKMKANKKAVALITGETPKTFALK